MRSEKKKKRTSRPSLLVKTLRCITSFCFFDFLTQLLRVKRNTILNAVALAFFFLLSYLLCFCCSKLFFFFYSQSYMLSHLLFFVCVFLCTFAHCAKRGSFSLSLFFFFLCFCFSLHSKPTDWTLLLLKSRLNGLAFNQRHSLFFVVFRRCFFFSTQQTVMETKRP